MNNKISRKSKKIKQRKKDAKKSINKILNNVINTRLNNYLKNLKLSAFVVSKFREKAKKTIIKRIREKNKNYDELPTYELVRFLFLDSYIIFETLIFDLGNFLELDKKCKNPFVPTRRIVDEIFSKKQINKQKEIIIDFFNKNKIVKNDFLICIKIRNYLTHKPKNFLEGEPIEPNNFPKTQKKFSFFNKFTFEETKNDFFDFILNEEVFKFNELIIKTINIVNDNS